MEDCKNKNICSWGRQNIKKYCGIFYDNDTNEIIIKTKKNSNCNNKSDKNNYNKIRNYRYHNVSNSCNDCLK